MVVVFFVFVGCGGGVVSIVESFVVSDIDLDGIIEVGILYILNGSFDLMVVFGVVMVLVNWYIFEGFIDFDFVMQEFVFVFVVDFLMQVDEMIYDIDFCEGVMFQNGDLVIVDDVVFSYECVFDLVNNFLFCLFVEFIDMVIVVDEDIVWIIIDYLFLFIDD